MRVQIYFNLHKKCLSIKRKGKVIGYCKSAELENVTFKVSESGRQRVIREKKKNVHAFIVGDIVSNDEEYTPTGELVKYNPYVFASFTKWSNRMLIHKAKRVTIINKDIYAEN